MAGSTAVGRPCKLAHNTLNGLARQLSYSISSQAIKSFSQCERFAPGSVRLGITPLLQRQYHRPINQFGGVYNLLMVSQRDYWLTSPSSMSRSRFGEYTSESIRVGYKSFSADAIAALKSFPALFAYEQATRQAARLGVLTRIAEPSSGDVRFHFALLEGVPAISPEAINNLSWELDLGEWEVNRTHWAVKDVDLIDVLKRASILPANFEWANRPRATSAASPTIALPIRPTVFAVPDTPQSETLVAVMMPFAREFDPVYLAIEASCRQAQLECKRADKIWEDATIIQDIFRLIYRSQLVVADLTGSNPNVLYEVGIAHTLGRPVVPIAQEPVARPFDIAHHRILGYTRTADGIAEMTDHLTRRIRYLTGR